MMARGGHGCSPRIREAVAGFFNHYLMGAKTSAPVPESPDIHRPPPHMRLVWWGRPAPPCMPGEEMRSIWRSRSEAALKPYLRNDRKSKEELLPLFSHILSITAESRAASKWRSPAGVKVEQEGDSVLVKAVRTPAEPADEGEFFSAYNRTATSRRVHEILAAVDQIPGQVALKGHGIAAWWCLLSATQENRIVAVDSHPPGDEELPALASYNQIGGPQALAKLLITPRSAGRI